MLEYWLWLTTRRGLGRQGMHAALRRFGSPEAVFYADAEAYRGIEGLKNAEPLEDKDLTEPRRILSARARRAGWGRGPRRTRAARSSQPAVRSNRGAMGLRCPRTLEARPRRGIYSF